ncbi:MAG: hypothetical protein P8J79_10135 [Halioglobus sp.]|nr:hypothetical protein [Halioglobus sp.]
MPFVVPPHESEQTAPVGFHPTQAAPDTKAKNFNISGGILGAIGGTPLVPLQKHFPSSHFCCFAKLRRIEVILQEEKESFWVNQYASLENSGMNPCQTLPDL